MTEQDLAKIKFRMVSHLNMETLHACTYESVNHVPSFEICVQTRLRDDDMFGGSYTHYRFNGKVYKTKKKFLEAITAFEEERKRKFKKQ